MHNEEKFRGIFTISTVIMITLVTMVKVTIKIIISNLILIRPMIRQ